MPTKQKTKRGRAQDRRLVSGKQKHEVAHVARVSGKSASTVKAAIKIHGHSRKKLMDALEEIRELLNMILPPKTKGAKKKIGISGREIVGAFKRGRKMVKRVN